VDILTTLTFLTNTTFLHLSIIFLAYLLVWKKLVYGSWVIDDDQGLQQFSGRFRLESKELPDKKVIPLGAPNYENIPGTIVPELLVDYYNQEIGKDEKNQPIVKQFKNT